MDEADHHCPAADTGHRRRRAAQPQHPAFLGVSGGTAQLTALARQLDIRFQRGAGDDEIYNVDHSSAILLIDPQVRYHARINAPHHAQDIRRQFLEIRRQWQSRTPPS